jgi:hypothetical protein
MSSFSAISRADSWVIGHSPGFFPEKNSVSTTIPCSRFGVAQLVHLRRERAVALEVRTGDAHLRADQLARVDRALELEVGVRLDAAGRAHRRHAAGEVEPREARRVLPVHRRLAARRRVVHVLVHADEPRHHGAAREVELGRARECGVLLVAELGDLRAVDDDELILARRRARAVDDAHVP